MTFYGFFNVSVAQPLHWIYNEDKLKGIIGSKEEVEFWEPSQNPFYRIPVGQQTCYGDQAYVILNSLVEKKGSILKLFVIICLYMCLKFAFAIIDFLLC